jgi:hypothetical protein
VHHHEAERPDRLDSPVMAFVLRHDRRADRAGRKRDQHRSRPPPRIPIVRRIGDAIPRLSSPTRFRNPRDNPVIGAIPATVAPGSIPQKNGATQQKRNRSVVRTDDSRQGVRPTWRFRSHRVGAPLAIANATLDRRAHAVDRRAHAVQRHGRLTNQNQPIGIGRGSVNAVRLFSISC